MNSQPEARCQCGTHRLVISGRPLFRAICHCHFCQDFNNSSYGDFLVYRQEDVALPTSPHMTYRSYSRPEIVQRGRCSQCNAPVVEHLRIPLFPKMAFVPVSTVKGCFECPVPAMHMFYHRRVADVDDQAPKYTGYIGSELSFMGRMIKDLMKGKW